MTTAAISPDGRGEARRRLASAAFSPLEATENEAVTPGVVARRPRVVVVGAGFAGLAAVEELRCREVDVVLVDQHNYHLFTPLLYQVASALLDPSEIAHPVRALLRRDRNVVFRMAQARSVDLVARRVLLEDESIGYDYLVLATGSVNDYFGNPSLRERTFGLKDLEQALALRYRILEQFERASSTADPDVRSRLLSFAVIGAGPTGVEYAGALSELVRLVLHKDFPELDIGAVRIFLVDGLPHVLAAFQPRLRRAAARALAGKGITLVLGSLVDDIDADRIRLNDGRVLEVGTVVWTAGVRGSDVGAALGVTLARGGRVRVEPTLQVPGHPEILVAGDLAAVEEDGRLLPMLSPVAIQQGRQAARNVMALIDGRSTAPFRFSNRGVMATIGRDQAVAQIGPLAFSGRVAWFVWLFVHLAFLIGFRNRVVALLDWAEDYVFYDRPVRLITRPSVPRGPAQATCERET